MSRGGGGSRRKPVAQGGGLPPRGTGGKPSVASWPRSFAFAGRGVALAWRERNFRVQCAAGWCALALSLLDGLPAGRVGVLVAVIAAVLSAETMNTAVEVVVDLVVQGQHPLAGAAKDLAAGAVLAMSLGALAVGLALFRPMWLQPAAAFTAIWARHPVGAVCAATVEAVLVTLAWSGSAGARGGGR